MRKYISLILLMIGMSVLVGCKPNVPAQEETARQLLIGEWKVEKETVTNGDGFGGVFTREADKSDLTLYEFMYDQHVRKLKGSQTAPIDYPTGLTPPVYEYTLQAQDDGTWRLAVVGLYDKQRNLVGGCSPITIHKLTRTNMEWEFESYGGDEGPVVYYQYLKKLNLPVNNQQ